MKSLSYFYLSVIVFSLSIFSLSTFAQRPIIYDSPQYEYSLAKELFEKEKYGSAQEYFKQVFDNEQTPQEMKVAAYYHIGICAFFLNNQDADFYLKNYIRLYPEHFNVSNAYFYLGKFYFDQKKYKQVLENFNQIDERFVPEKYVKEYQFKKGYAYFATKRIDEAKPLFNEVRKTENEYQKKAIYYLAHIAYSNEQYEAAMEDFLLLKEDKNYQSSIPFYLAQIYFYQKKYEEVLKTAVPILDKADNKTEMSRIIALSYYNLQRYSEALPYFENYIKSSRTTLDRNDNFAIGYSYYQMKNYQVAIRYLSLTTYEKDEMCQNSFYLIGDCYLKNGDPTFASQSFFEASKYDFSPDIKEDALYNYAKLQYETSNSPFNTAIAALEQYIQEYPNSSRSEEAIAYLSQIYLTTKNYQGAINSLEKLQSKSPTLLRAYQRCTHFRALELINNKKYNEALILINKSTKYPMNGIMHASNLYWKAETEYRKELFKESFFSFQTYYKTTNVGNEPNYPISFYSFGYTAMKINKYKDAEGAFEKFLKFDIAKENPMLEADASARLGDCYFMQKNLKKALASYESCEKLRQENVDYAIYQQSKCYGYLNDEKSKIVALEKLINHYPKSSYVDDAEYDLASSYHAQNNYTYSISAFKTFIGKYPKSTYIRQAYNKLAQAYLNSQDLESSIKTFKYVFENFPGSNEAKDALANLENIYTELGTTGEFFDYIKNKGNINISVSKQDSISYKAAENKYLRGDCENAITAFDSYLQAFPDGLFAADAHFQKAECLYGLNDYTAALQEYEIIIQRYKTKNNETALRKAAMIVFNNKDYNKALTYFTAFADISSSVNNSIIAYTGIMRSSYQVNKFDIAHKSAEVLIYNLPTDDELKNEALYIAGKSSYQLGEFNIAKQNLAVLAKKTTNDLGAEAAYLTALIAFNQNDLKECEKIIGEILAASYSSDFWYANTFILYGDLYAAKGNLFQAKHTYQSIVDNYEGQDLVKIAQEKIDKIVETEQQNEAPSQSDDLQIIEE